MILRIAASLSLVVFALCLVVGGIEAHNPFGTTVQTALMAMASTLVIGLFVGYGFDVLLRENLAQEAEKLKQSSESPATADR
jgi:NhaP-type Na+/H+ or K+/H+ antiporter